MPSACAPRGRPSEALGRTVSQSAGSEACVANCSITRSSSTSVTFADLLGEYVAYYHQDRTHYALEKETPGGRLPSASQGAGAAIRGSQAAGRFASPVPLGCTEEWADRFWRATRDFRGFLRLASRPW